MNVQWCHRDHRSRPKLPGQPWDARGKCHRDKKQKPTKEPRRARNVPAAVAIDEKRERKREQSGTDDPGEAAANYFILKLLGYPDVKVLVT